MTGARTSRVTTVVITRNRLEDLRRTLPRHRPPVVLVDNGSSDGTVAYVTERFPWIETVALGQNIGAPARNVGAERSSTPYVAFADDDSWWRPGALIDAADVLDRHPRLAVLAARMLLDDSGREDPVCAQMAAAPLGTEPDLPGPSVLGFLACGAVVRRDAFLSVGGFDEVLFFGGEEERVALDLLTTGWGMAYAPEVVAEHRPSTSRVPSQRRRRWARNQVLTALMRRPWSVVGRQVWQVAGSPTGLGALVLAVPRAPRALARRAVVPAEVEAARRALAQQAR